MRKLPTYDLSILLQALFHNSYMVEDGWYFGIHGKLLHETLRPYEEFELFVNCFELVFHFRNISSRYFVDSIFHFPKCVVEDMERPKTG